MGFLPFQLGSSCCCCLGSSSGEKYTSHQKRILVEDLNRKWKRVILSTSPTTAVEHCEWLNKMFMEFWPNYFNPRLSTRFSHMVEKLLKERKPKLIEWVELQEFSLGSSPPSLGLNGTRWATSGDQRVMHMGFDWDTCDMSIMLLAKLAKPLGTARIVVNSLQIKGDLLLMPILDGRAILYSFVSTPEVRIGVAFGSGGSQIPGTELPGVSSWLVKLCSDTLDKTMVEPRRRCFSLPAVDLRKKAIGGIIHVTIVSAGKMSRGSFRGSPSRKQQSSEDHFEEKDLQTFVEVELGQLTRRTSVRPGSSPKWNSTFNMVLHEETGILKFNLCNCNPGSVKYDYLASCEIKMKYVADDSTVFWAIGPDSSIIAKHAEFSGREVEMIVPFEGPSTGELAVKLVMKEWQYSDGTHSLNKYKSSSRQSVDGSSIIPSRTGRKINLTVVEGKDFTAKERSGKCNAYVKLQYGKAVQRTKTSLSPNPTWNQKFEFDEIGGDEYIKLKCYSEEVFGDESIGSARVNLEGLLEGSIKDAWIPLEKVNSGELRLLIEAVKVEDEASKSSMSSGGWIELVIIEARDLIAADLRGTSDPYVRVQYGSLKRRTKVLFKTLTPQWNQTLEFPDNGSPLELHVKDHNALLPGYNIGDCVVEYQRLPPNQTADKWIPLQGVKRGEIHVRVTRRVPEQPKKSSPESEPCVSKSHQIAGQLKHMMVKFRSSMEGGNLDELSVAMSEMESVADSQEEYMVQLETEQMLLLNKIKELGEEMNNSSPVLQRRSSAAV
ncbi:SYT5 [Linum grandiflorum]